MRRPPIAVGAPAVRAVRVASATLPVVMYGNFDPVAPGLVASLARRGGNTTGVLIAPDGTLAGKRLELLGQVVPGVTRFAYLGPPADVSASLQQAETRQAAAPRGVPLVDVELREVDYEAAFASLAAQRPGALLVAAHVDGILKGARPAGMAVERPSHFDLVIHLKTARALGPTIPQAPLLRAAEVLQ